MAVRNDEIEKFEQHIREKLRTITKVKNRKFSKGGKAGDMSRGASSLLDSINQVADNVMIADTPEESKGNIESIQSISKVIKTLRASGQINTDQQKKLESMLDVLSKTSIQGLKEKGGKLTKKGKIKLPEETVGGKIKGALKGAKKFTTLGAIAGIFLDSPALVAGALWLSDRREKKKEEADEKLKEEKDLIKKVYEDKQSAIQEDVSEGKRDKERAKAGGTYKEAQYWLRKNQEKKKKKLGLPSGPTTPSLRGKTTTPALPPKKSYTEIGSPEYQKKVKKIRETVKEEMWGSAIAGLEIGGRKFEKNAPPEQKEKIRKITDQVIDVARKEQEKDLGQKIELADDLSKETNTLISEIMSEAGGAAEEMGVSPESMAPNKEQMLQAALRANKIPEGVTAVSEYRQPVTPTLPSRGYPSGPASTSESLSEGSEKADVFFDNFFPGGPYYNMIEQIGNGFKEFKTNWEKVYSPKQVEDRDSWLKRIDSNFQLFIENAGYAKVNKGKNEKEEGGSGGRRKGGVVDTMLGGAKKFGMNMLGGMLPTAGGLSAGAGYTGVGGIAAGIGGGLVLGAPIAALGLTMNELWKQQQGVEDQEMAAIVNSTGVRGGEKKIQLLWNEFAKENRITPLVEEKLIGDIPYNNRVEKIMGMVSNVRTGRAGKNLQQKWSKFTKEKAKEKKKKEAAITAAKPGEAVVPTPKSPAITTSAPIEPTAKEVPPAIASAVGGGPVSAGNITLANPNVDVGGIEPGLQGKLLDVAAGYKNATGEKLQVNSGFRSFEEQAELRQVNANAASPEKSPHVKRKAFDAQSGQIKRAKELGLMESAGLTTPVRGEPWHVEAAKTGSPLRSLPTPSVGSTPPTHIQAPTGNAPVTNITQNTGIITPPDLRHFLGDEVLRLNASSRVAE